MQPTQNQPTGAPPGTFNPQYGIGGQQTSQMPGQQVSAPGFISTFRSPAATSQQFQAMSGMYAASTVAATMQFGGQFAGIGAPMIRPIAQAMTSSGTAMHTAAGGLRFIDPFHYAGMAYRGTSQMVGGGVMAAEQAFMSSAVNARRLGGLLAGGVAATGVGLAGLALTEGILHAGQQIYRGAEGATQGMGFAAEHMSNFNYSRQQAQSLGAQGGFIDSASQMMGTNYEGLSQMTGMLTQQGDMRGVNNMSQFKQRLLSKLKQIKDLSREADVSLAEANQILQALKQQGFNESAGQTGVTSLKDASSALMNRARSAGIDPNALVQAGQMGAQTAFQMGLGRSYGSAMGQSMLGTLTGMYDSNAVNRAYVDQLGGTQQVAAQMSQKIMQSTQALGMAVLGTDAQGNISIDHAKLQRLQSGETTLDKEMEKIQKQAGANQAFAKQINDRMHRMVNDPKLSGDLQKAAVGLLQTQAFTDPSGMSHTLGMSAKQIELMGGMLSASSTEAGRVEAERRNSLARSQEAALLQRSEQFGYDTTLSNRYLSGADRALQRMGRGLQEAGADFASQFRNRTSTVEGISSNDMAAFRQLMRERDAGTAISAQRMGRRVNAFGGLTATHSQYGVGTDNIGGFLFGGVDDDLREALFSAPSAQRFLTTVAPGPGGIEGQDYLEVDKTGFNFFGDEVYFDMRAFEAALPQQQRGLRASRERFDKQNQAVAENMVAAIRSRGRVRTGRREALGLDFESEQGALSDLQVRDLYQDYLDAGGQAPRISGFQSKAHSDKAKLAALKKLGVTGISQKNNPGFDTQVEAAIANLNPADRKKYHALYQADYNTGRALTTTEEIRGFLRGTLVQGGLTEEEALAFGASLDELNLGFSTIEDARKKLAQGQFAYTHTTGRHHMLGALFGTTKTTQVAGLEEEDLAGMSASQMVQISKVLKDKKLTDAQKEASIRKLGVSESFVTKISEGIRDASVTGNTQALDQFTRQIGAFGAHVLDKEVGGKIAENIRSQSMEQGRFLSALGVDFGTIDKLQNFDSLSSDGSAIGKELMMKGLGITDLGDRARFFEGLSMTGLGDLGSRANLAAGLMSSDAATRKKATDALGLPSASQALTADQATNFLRDKGLLNILDSAAAGREGGGGTRLKVNDFGSAVMAFHQAVNIFAANAKGDPSNAPVLNPNNSVGSNAGGSTGYFNFFN